MVDLAVSVFDAAYSLPRLILLSLLRTGRWLMFARGIYHDNDNSVGTCILVDDRDPARLDPGRLDGLITRRLWFL